MRTACLVLLTLLAPPPGRAAGPSAPARLSARSPVPARVRIRKQHLDRWYGKHRVHAEVNFPEVVGLADTTLQARINRTIRSAFPPPYGFEVWVENNDRAEDLEPGMNIEMFGDYEVTLNRNHVLSVRFWGFDDIEKDGNITAPHPNLQDAAVTLDTRTGKPFKLSDLFASPHWRERLEKLIARYAGLAPGPHKPVAIDPELIARLKSHEYWYHLKPDSVRFYDLYGNYAMRAVESEIPLEQLRPLMNPKGPLPALLAASRTGARK
jgi:hypothetical protein